MSIDLKKFVKTASGSSGNRKQKKVVSINTTSGKLNISTALISQLDKSKKYSVLRAKDNKSLAIVSDKDGVSPKSLSLVLADMKELGIEKNGFTIQYASRFDSGMVLVNLENSVLTTAHKVKS